MSENYAFPDRMMLFRRDRKMTQGDHCAHNPSDWHWYVRDDLYADMERQLAEAREVKPLEWGPPLAGFHQAILPWGGKLEIMWDLVHGVETFVLHPGTPDRKHFPTLEAAKAAAQADYEARILSAMKGTP